MKAVVLCLVLVAVGINADVHLSGEQKERADKYAAECVKESGVKPELLAEAKKGHLTEDEGLKKFALCFFQKSGIVGPDGKLNVETALAKLPPGIDKAEASKLLDTCKTKTGKDAADTAFEIFKCYQSSTKSHILL